MQSIYFGKVVGMNNKYNNVTAHIKHIQPQSNLYNSVIILITATLPRPDHDSQTGSKKRFQAVAFLSLKDLKEVIQPSHMGGRDKGGTGEWCH